MRGIPDVPLLFIVMLGEYKRRINTTCVAWQTNLSRIIPIKIGSEKNTSAEARFRRQVF